MTIQNETTTPNQDRSYRSVQQPFNSDNYGRIISLMFFISLESVLLLILWQDLLVQGCLRQSMVKSLDLVQLLAVLPESNAIKDIALYRQILNYVHVKVMDNGLEEIRLLSHVKVSQSYDIIVARVVDTKAKGVCRRPNQIP